ASPFAALAVGTGGAASGKACRKSPVGRGRGGGARIDRPPPAAAAAGARYSDENRDLFVRSPAGIDAPRRCAFPGVRSHGPLSGEDRDAAPLPTPPQERLCCQPGAGTPGSVACHGVETDEQVPVANAGLASPAAELDKARTTGPCRRFMNRGCCMRICSGPVPERLDDQ